MKLSYGNIVSEKFCERVIQISRALLIPEPSYLMACMAFETGETFSPSIGNKAGSGAVGLIQFMPATAQALGTSTIELVNMTAEEQLGFVFNYFVSLRGRLCTLSDLYMAILWPAAIGKSDDFVLFRKNDILHPRRYMQNAGLDFNKDGEITKIEACNRVYEKYYRGFNVGLVREIPS